MPLFTPASFSVAELTRRLRLLLESDAVMQDVWVRGEISNLSRPASGHIYFSLKDEFAALRCVIWRSAAARLQGALQNGQAVELHGAVSVYERDGNYQLYVDALRPVGEGYLYQQFVRLKAKLEAEGLFEEARKRPLPPRPKVIGIVTSATGAALQDMLNTLAGRYPLAEVWLAPAAVQGESAPAELTAALARLNREARVEVILLARGGGSLEDLWAFNDEDLVRAVAASRAPVVTGIGHETDFTLADFAADLRAPTPTGAAVLSTPEFGDLAGELNEITRRLYQAAFTAAAMPRARLDSLNLRLAHASPDWRIRSGRQALDGLAARLNQSAGHRASLERSRLGSLRASLAALSPLNVLNRGYALLSRADGRLVTSAGDAHPGDHLHARLRDGALDVQVLKTEKPASTQRSAE